jgi:hypothetical protein
VKTHPVLSLLVFTCFLVIGYTYSTRFYQPGNPITASSLKIVTTEGTNPIASMHNGQRNILLIGVSTLDMKTSTLESLWLLTYIPKDSSIQLFPIYPAQKQQVSDFDTQLAQVFHLNRIGRHLELDSSFTGLLEKNNFWWSGYVIFDENFLAKIIDLYDIEENGEPVSGSDFIPVLHNKIDDQRKIFSSQVSFYQSLCNKYVKSEPGSNISQLSQLVPDHLLTDMDISQLQHELDSLSTNGHPPACRFPTLEISQIGP